MDEVITLWGRFNRFVETSAVGLKAQNSLHGFARADNPDMRRVFDDKHCCFYCLHIVNGVATYCQIYASRPQLAD